MDWLRKKAARLGAEFRNASLAKSLFFYMAAGAVAGMMLWILSKNLCESWFKVFTGKNLQENFILSWEIAHEGTAAMGFLWFWYWYGQYPCLAVCCTAAGGMFLQKKIYPALKAVQDAIGCIGAGDYGREIAYLDGDEMGGLCRSFEQLRRKLVREKRSRWMEQESQRRINAAFAHDIRTPLTVLSGCTEFLEKYVPKGKVSEEKLLEKLAVMHHQEQRILEISKTMTLLHRQEAREVSGAWQEGTILVQRLGMAARELAVEKKKTCRIEAQGIEGNFFADGGLIEEVFDNLVSNALRYAQNGIIVAFVRSGEEFLIYVRDDGAGFSHKALRYGTDPYYSEDKEGGGHFGLGLFISRMLCEKHGGTLKLVNSIDGGGIAAAAFLVGV